MNNSVTVINDQLLFLVLALICSVTWDKSLTACFFSCEREKSRLRHTGLVFSKCLVLAEDMELPSNGHWSVLLFSMMDYISWADVLLAPAFSG